MMENAELRKKTELQAHRLDQAIVALEKISQALTAVTVGTDNLLRAVAHATADILDVPYASLHLRKPSWRQQFSDVGAFETADWRSQARMGPNSSHSSRPGKTRAPATRPALVSRSRCQWISLLRRMCHDRRA